MQRGDEFNKLLADKLLIGAIGASIIILLAECVVPGPVPPVLVIIATAFFGVHKYYRTTTTTPNSNSFGNEVKMDTKEQATTSDSKSVSSTEIQK